jgi:SAM-dependent methyltransferase
VEREYAVRYRELYRRHWWWRARERLILDVLERLQPQGGWSAILDVGCGDALFFERLARFGHVEGVEPDASLLTPDGPYRDHIHVGPFDASFRPSRCYGLILMLDVLEHLRDPVEALRHALALLRPGGRVLVTVPAFRLLWTNHDVLNRHYTRYTRASFARVARAAGLRIDGSRYLFHWLFPAKLGQRLLEAVWPRPPAPPRVPPAWINRVLYLGSRAEQIVLGGLPMPFGTSLLVIGGKP